MGETNYGLLSVILLIPFQQVTAGGVQRPLLLTLALAHGELQGQCCLHVM